MSKLKWMKWVFFLLPMVISMGPCQFQSICKTSTGPDPIDDPWQYGGEIEILLESSRNIDFTKTAISVYHTKYGGRNATYWVAVGENQWTAVISLNCEPQPYFLMTGCYKLNVDNFYMRRKGDINWIRLTCIVDEPGGCPPSCDCKALKFIFNNGQIQNPSGC